MQENLKFYLAVMAGAIFAVMQARQQPYLARIGIAAFSGAIASGLAEDVAAWSGWPIVVVGFILAGFGYAIADVTASIIRDPEFLRAILRKRLGGDDK